jgi:signal transduction histidine kinase
VESLKDTAAERGIDLVLRLPRSLPPVWALRNKLEQAFAILVENALKYTNRNGRVSVGAAATDTAVEVAVSDTGIGIAPDDRDAIFREFYRAANAKQRQRVGTGLGLAIARGIVEDLGGAIRVDSELGRGSTFTVTLPLSAPATSAKPAGPPPF